MSRFDELCETKLLQLDEQVPAPAVAGQAPTQAPVAGQAQQAQPASPQQAQQALAAALAQVPWQQTPAATTMLNNAIKQLPGPAHNYLQSIVYDTKTKGFIVKPTGGQQGTTAATTSTVGTTPTTASAGQAPAAAATPAI